MTKPSASSCRVDLRQELRRQAKLVDRLAKPPGQTPRIKSATLLQRSPAIDCRKTEIELGLPDEPYSVSVS
jgi:hypothetical protein